MVQNQSAHGISQDKVSQHGESIHSVNLLPVVLCDHLGSHEAWSSTRH